MAANDLSDGIYSRYELELNGFGEYIVNENHLKNVIGESKALILMESHINGLHSQNVLFQKLTLLGIKFDSFISPHSTIHDSVRITPNSIISSGVIINKGVQLGTCVCIGEGTYIGQSVKLKNFINIQSFVKLGSLTSIGAMSTIAEGTIISPGTRIGRGVFVGYKKHIQADIEDYICYMVEGQEPAITRVYQ